MQDRLVAAGLLVYRPATRRRKDVRITSKYLKILTRNAGDPLLIKTAGCWINVCVPSVSAKLRACLFSLQEKSRIRRSATHRVLPLPSMLALSLKKSFIKCVYIFFCTTSVTYCIVKISLLKYIHKISNLSFICRSFRFCYAWITNCTFASASVLLKFVPRSTYLAKEKKSSLSPISVWEIIWNII